MPKYKDLTRNKIKHFIFVCDLECVQRDKNFIEFFFSFSIMHTCDVFFFNAIVITNTVV